MAAACLPDLGKIAHSCSSGVCVCVCACVACSSGCACSAGTCHVALFEALFGDSVCQGIQVLRLELHFHPGLEQVCLPTLPSPSHSPAFTIATSLPVTVDIIEQHETHKVARGSAPARASRYAPARARAGVAPSLARRQGYWSCGRSAASPSHPRLQARSTPEAPSQHVPRPDGRRLRCLRAAPAAGAS